jgi:NhaP-type Na+/H+ or K+/H+ antiporter
MAKLLYFEHSKQPGVNQEMEINWNQISKELAVVFLVLLLFGVSYNILVQYFQKRTHHYTAEFVVGGCLVTVLGSGFIIGWDNALIVVICFIASGTPMIVGSMMAHAQDEQEAKKVARDELKGLNR